MPRYFYTARNITGELKSGVGEARDKYELARTLKERGEILVSAVLEENRKKPLIFFLRKWQNLFFFWGRVGLKEKMFFTRNLRVMIAAGLSLPRALKVLAEQTRNKKFKKALNDISERITKGENFSLALSRYPDIFSELFQNMIKVGEESGTLEDVLKVLAEQMEKEHELKSKIIGAMIYPAVIITAMIGIGILMLIMVVPKLAETFKELNVELPFTTKLVIFIGNFLSEKWYWLFLAIILFVILFRMLLKSNFGKQIMAGLFLKTPFVSGIVKKTNSALTARTLSSLIVAGVPIVRSLEIISQTMGNIYFKKAIATAAEKVKKGEKLHQALQPYQNLYPSMVVEMVKIGEETGETADILAKLAEFYEEEVANLTKNLSSVIEPVLMLFIGGVIGFFAVSMIQPMYSMLGAIK